MLKFRVLNIPLVLFLAILATLINSCSYEFRTAKTITKSYYGANVMLVFPESIILTNSKYYYWEEDINDPNQKYFQKIDSSAVLKFVDVSKLTSDYKDSMNQSLRKANFRVFETTNWDDFFKQPGRKLVINVEQIELEEKYTTFYDEYDDGNNLYSKELLVTALQFNHWISVVYDMDSSLSKNLIYFEDGVSDEVSGEFVYKVRFKDYYYVYDYKLVDNSQIPILTTRSVNHSVQNAINFSINSELSDSMRIKFQYEPAAFWRIKFSDHKSYPDYEFKNDYTIMNLR